MARKKADLAGEVFDHLASAPEGLTLAELSEKTLRPIAAVRRAVRTCRLTLASNGDTLFIVADTQGSRRERLDCQSDR
jgi:IclR helix-turn-helix domain